jgi:hypothetical protein
VLVLVGDGTSTNRASSDTNIDDKDERVDVIGTRVVGRPMPTRICTKEQEQGKKENINHSSLRIKLDTMCIVSQL